MKSEQTSKTIGFTNFRKFESFPDLLLGNLTFMVGRNNSGKSTLVKSLILVIDYLQNQLEESFSFDNEFLEDTNIVTFGRAKNKFSKNPEIIFNLKLDDISVEVSIFGDEDQTSADVKSITIIQKSLGYSFQINFVSNELTVQLNEVDLNTNEDGKTNLINQLKARISELNGEMNETKVDISKSVLRMKDELNSLKAKVEKATNSKDSLSKEAFNVKLTYPIDYKRLKPIEHFLDIDNVLNNPDDDIFNNVVDEFDDSELEYNIKNTEDHPLKEYLSLFLYHNNVRYSRIIGTKGSETIEELDDVKYLHNEQNKLVNWIENIANKINKQKFAYIPANPVKQSALFSIRDKKNPLAQAIHEFHQLKVARNTQVDLFVKKWMNNFEIGQDYEIQFYAGEAYEFYVMDNGSKIHLSDKGMGSLQAMLLILKIAHLKAQNKKEKKNTLLLIEEPELNLHPALQSLLTDLFYEVSISDNIQFIIETHSEYLIRKSQVIVNQNKYGNQESLNPNPFKVYYFPVEKDDLPYEMIYREDGKFSNEFRPGFFDISSDLAFDIL